MSDGSSSRALRVPVVRGAWGRGQRVAEGMRRAWRRRRYEALLRRLAGPQLIAAFAAAHPRAFFVEIGANDGEQHDHLREAIRTGEWRGIMVEPVPYVFERLARNYAGVDRVILENAAIADRDGTLPFYHLVAPDATERADLPSWYDGVGSFSRDTLLGHADEIPDLQRRIVCAQVPALTLDSLCAKHGVQRIDLLVIDTEGYDHEILRAIDLRRWAPELLVYEHFHFSAPQRDATRASLQAAGYQTMEEGFDTWCLHESADAAVASVWRRLRPAVAGVAAYEVAA